jgi:hypothetical protein
MEEEGRGWEWECCCTSEVLPVWHMVANATLSVFFFVSLLWASKKALHVILGMGIPLGLLVGALNFFLQNWLRSHNTKNFGVSSEFGNEEGGGGSSSIAVLLDGVVSYGIFGMAFLPELVLIACGLLPLIKTPGRILGFLILIGGVGSIAVFWYVNGRFFLPPLPFVRQFSITFLLGMTYSTLLGYVYAVIYDFYCLDDGISFYFSFYFCYSLAILC